MFGYSNETCQAKMEAIVIEFALILNEMSMFAGVYGFFLLWERRALCMEVLQTRQRERGISGKPD